MGSATRSRPGVSQGGSISLPGSSGPKALFRGTRTRKGDTQDTQNGREARVPPDDSRADRSGKETRLPKASALRPLRPAPRQQPWYLAGQDPPLRPGSAELDSLGPSVRLGKRSRHCFGNRGSQLDFWIQTPAFIRCAIIRLDRIPPICERKQ